MQPESRGVSLSPKVWWIALAAVVVIGEGVGFLAASQGADTAASTVRLIGRMAAIGWLGFGLWHWHEVPIVARFGLYFVLSLVAAIAWAVSLALQWHGMAASIIAMYVLAAVFVLGLVVVRLLLTPSYGVFGVARTLIDEAIRMKIAIVFVVGMLLILPLLPLTLDAGEFLQYRIQGFLTWSLVLMAFLLGLMTVFLSVSTITTDLKTKRIFLTMTKPVGAGTYLLGKWLGIALLNAILVMVFGGSIYFFATMLAKQAEDMPPNDAQRIAVQERVMVARLAESPDLPGEASWDVLYQDRLAELRQQNPAEYRTIDDETRANILKSIHREWYRLSPRMGNAYQFNNLLPAKEQDTMVQLRLTPRIGGETHDDRVQLMLRVNGRAVPTSRMSDRTTHIVNIPTALIDEEGRMLVQIANPPTPVGNPPQGYVDQPTVSFDVDDGIQMLYRVGGFEMNFVRAMLIIWLSTLFLAAVGLTAGTYLSFPVACVFCLMVYIAAVGSTFIYESMKYYAPGPPPDATTWERITGYPMIIIDSIGQGEIFQACKVIIELTGRTFMLMVPDFAGYNPVTRINDGLLIPWFEVGTAFFWVGVVATGIVGLIGFAIFRGKEMAQVTV